MKWSTEIALVVLGLALGFIIAFVWGAGSESPNLPVGLPIHSMEAFLVRPPISVRCLIYLGFEQEQRTYKRTNMFDLVLLQVIDFIGFN